MIRIPTAARAETPITLPALPYPENALEPIVSARTVGFHHGKHHRAYVDNLNKLIAGSELAESDLGTIVRETAGKPDKASVFNNAAQAWNHNFYWKSLTPKGGGIPSGKLAEMAETSFGGIDALKKELQNAAVTQFGSGWAWLVLEGGKLKVMKTSNADNPMISGAKPLLVIDVWEHAYYLDYQNRRADHVAAVIDGLLNWNFALQNL
jgi:Fe-Mn family superoxide dismutase